MKTLTPLLLVAGLSVVRSRHEHEHGDITVQGNRAHYELRMPVYEIAHVKNPDTSLFEHIHFSTAGQEGRLFKIMPRRHEPGFVPVLE